MEPAVDRPERPVAASWSKASNEHKALPGGGCMRMSLVAGASVEVWLSLLFPNSADRECRDSEGSLKKAASVRKFGEFSMSVPPSIPFAAGPRQLV